MKEDTAAQIKTADTWIRKW